VIGGWPLLLKDFLHGGLATDCLFRAMLALVMGFVADKVWAFLGGRELVLMKEKDVGFGAGTLILGIVDEVDPLQIWCHSDGRGR